MNFSFGNWRQPRGLWRQFPVLVADHRDSQCSNKSDLPVCGSLQIERQNEENRRDYGENQNVNNHLTA